MSLVETNLNLWINLTLSPHGALHMNLVGVEGRDAILAQLAARQSHNLKAVSSNLTCRITFCPDCNRSTSSIAK